MMKYTDSDDNCQALGVFSIQSGEQYQFENQSQTPCEVYHNEYQEIQSQDRVQQQRSTEIRGYIANQGIEDVIILKQGLIGQHSYEQQIDGYLSQEYHEQQVQGSFRYQFLDQRMQSSLRQSQREKQAETKNIALQYLRMLVNHINKNKELQTKFVMNEIEITMKKGDKGRSLQFGLKQMRKFLSNHEINKIAMEYFESCQFLSDLLSSEQLQNVRVPIRYVGKLIQGIKNPKSLTCWKS